MSHKKSLIIAIDGPGGSGKSTVARAVARRLGFTYIDSGAMYRAVALWALRLGMDLDDLHRLEQLAQEAHIELPGDLVLLNGEDVTAQIRDQRVSEAASRVAAQPGVRRAMRDEQRRIGQAGSAVMEGRDIDAQLRVEHRAEERAACGVVTPHVVEVVARDLEARDRRDRNRAEAPLSQAPDAEYLDTTHLTPAQVEEAVLKLVRARTSNGKDHT